MLKNVSLGEIERMLDQGLSPVERIEYCQLYVEKQLEALTNRRELFVGPEVIKRFDTMGITWDMLPEVDLSESERGVILGMLPYDVAILKYGREMGYSKEKIDECEREMESGIRGLASFHQNLPVQEIGSLTAKWATLLVRCFHDIAAILDSMEKGDPQREFFFEYIASCEVASRAGGFPDFRWALSKLFSEILGGSNSENE